MPRLFQEFPKYKYHPHHGSKIVHNPDQEAALGPEWADRPQPGQSQEAQAARPSGADAQGCSGCRRLAAEMAEMNRDFQTRWNEREQNFSGLYGELQEQYNQLFADLTALRQQNPEPPAAEAPAPEEPEKPSRRVARRSA